MKNILIISIVVITSITCSNTISSDEMKSANSIEEVILNMAIREDNSNDNLIKSHFLLSNLILNESQISLLEKSISSESDDSIRNLLTLHLLWIQTQEDKFKIEFIKKYPVSDKLVILNNEIVKTDYRIASSPLQNTLASFAVDNKNALEKLINSIPFVDGANADVLYDLLRNIYNMNEDVFKSVSANLGINVNEIIK